MRTRGRLLAAGLTVALALSACGEAQVPWSVATPAPTPGATATPAPSPSAPATASPSAPATASPSPSPVAGGWSFVASAACPESEFTCVTLAVPRDHYRAGGPTWDMTFAIRRATGKKLGTYVVITGGPGSSGIAAADSYTSYYPASIPEHFDIVFIDQRGVGATKPIACPDATAAFYAVDEPDGDPATDAAFASAAKAYAADCVSEARVDPADLPYFSTRQAVEDLEAAREYLGVAKMHLYGESYGTQFAQTYAAAHPDRIATLYLDGPVDLTVDGATYYGATVRTFNDTFIATVNACRADSACRADLGDTDPLAAYDALLARARAGGVGLAFPMGDGSTQQRTLTAGAIEAAVVGYLYSGGDRQLLLRALAAAGRDNLVPLARLAYASLEVDPDTLRPVVDPSYSDAMYYAVECQDYVYSADAGDEAARTAAFLAEGRANGAQGARFGSLYYGDMPCLYWPNTPPADPRPAPIVNAPYPTVVMVATTDPITPVENAVRIANRLSRATLVIQTGGPHVIFGWGLACPDDLIADYMVGGKRLAGPLVTCPGSVADPYVPLAKASASDYGSTAAFLDGFADQILTTNDYVDMLSDTPISLGCDFGGTLTYTPGDSGTELALRGCAFTQGLAVSGTGLADADGGITLRATLPDGEVSFSRDADDNVTVRGGCLPKACLVAGP